MVSNIDHKAVGALLHGQECANSLKKLFDNGDISLGSTESLIDTILDTFSLALSCMDAPNPPQHYESSFGNMAGFVLQRSSKKKICAMESIENYKDSPTPRPNDGFTWRKYGQKNIKTSPYQRCYYRCSYAKDLNCKCTKRVQKIKDNPPLYRTIYVGKHVCKAFTVHDDDTYGSEMIKFDQVLSEPVMPQLATIDHQATTMAMEDIAIDHAMNQECDINDILVDYDQFWANQFPSGDTMFLDNLCFF
ncbi:hypothetical protein CARUB_v10021899mg [Capsella rubella]|uniref:WRKY domain-containing protein n=1 Tax=Capsella rubella TaxID=81985 RepID=R0I8F1_9BRAS|nr:probable WRKY transcription factor 64 [Capsella rubella]EOA34375.1 hypothetical protein CARUB_v10021899mg [Capsella rubella]